MAFSFKLTDCTTYKGSVQSYIAEHLVSHVTWTLTSVANNTCHIDAYVSVSVLQFQIQSIIMVVYSYLFHPQVV